MRQSHDPIMFRPALSGGDHPAPAWRVVRLPARRAIGVSPSVALPVMASGHLFRRLRHPRANMEAPLLLVVACALGFWPAFLTSASAQTTIRVAPPERTVFVTGQRFDLRVEATASRGSVPPRGLRVTVDGADLTSRNILDPGAGGERGAGGTGATNPNLAARDRASRAPVHSTNFLLRGYSFDRAGRHVIEARTADGALTRVTVEAVAWQTPSRQPGRARNVILLLGDGMGLAHRTAARIVSRGLTAGKANDRLAMDSLEAVGQVMTSSLNAVVTDSSPGMAAYVTGSKSANGQQGVYPDNTDEDVFDNPRVEYLGELLRRLRGPGFNVGIVTTADVTDATPAANAVHTALRGASPGIAARYFDERATNGVTVLLGGGRRHFVSASQTGPGRKDGRNLVAEFTAAGYESVESAARLRRLLATPSPPRALLGLFHRDHMSVAFDKVGAGRYSLDLEDPTRAALRDQPMLDEMARLALRTLAAHSPKGFYLMIEGASIDKQAHDADAERTIWDTIEFDNAVGVALEFADRTNADADPSNDTLVIVTADHECGGLAILGAGNERYQPARLGRAVRDYAAARFGVTRGLDQFTNYAVDEQGFPTDPDPSRKLLLAWAAAPDRYENWVSNRRPGPATVVAGREASGRAVPVATANVGRDGEGDSSDNRGLDGRAIPGFLVRGVIENGEEACEAQANCPADSSSIPQTSAGHTASDIVLGASGPGAIQFTGVYDNTEVFAKVLRAMAGTWSGQLVRTR